MNSIPTTLPNGLLEHSRGLRRITDITPFTVKVGKYYYVRLNNTNPKGNREYNDLFVKIKDMSTTQIHVHIVSVREYYKAWDMNDKYTMASANVAENGSVTRLEHIGANDRQVYTNTSNIYKNMLTHIEFYDTGIKPLTDELNKTNNASEVRRLENEIADLKDEWYSTPYVIQRETGEPLPALWEKDGRDFIIPIQYISVNNTEKPYEYIFYGPIVESAPSAGGGYRRRVRKTRRRARRHVKRV